MNCPKSVLFVCLGNICRSPSAEAVMRKKAHQQGLSTILFDSAGTANYHIGEKPDHRAIAIGQKFDYNLNNIRARQIDVMDFYRFDVIFAMDQNNLKQLQELQKKAHKLNEKAAFGTLLAFDKADVADPYYGGLSDFEQMFIYIEKIADDWLAQWQGCHGFYQFNGK